MSSFAPEDRWARDRSPNRPIDKWLVFGAASLMFFFLNLATFTSLGVVLFTMVGELHWSHTVAGFSFAFLGLACGLTSPLPAMAMKRLGGRATMSAGAVLLVVGFYIASVSHSVLTFYIGMAFLGSGYSLAGNVPSVCLIAAWFEHGAARIIGFYMMLGALGQAFGPPIVLVIVNGTGSWRGHWQVMAITAAIVGVICFALIRDARTKPASAPEPSTVEGGAAVIAAETGWTPRAAVLTPQFLLVAAAMTATLFCVTTYSSMMVSHLTRLGATPREAALVLSYIAITATLVKALSGRLCEIVPPKYISAGGLLFQAAGTLMLAFADDGMLRYSSAIAFGTGWGLTYVAGTVVVLDYFGGAAGSKALSMVWFLASVAAAGPPLAGMIADRYGTFVPIFFIFAIMLVAIAVPTSVMRRPVARSGAARAAGLAPAPALIRNAETI